MATWSIEAIREIGVPAVLGKLAPRLFGAMSRVHESEIALGRRIGRALGLASQAELDTARAHIARLEGKLRRLERALAVPEERA